MCRNIEALFNYDPPAAKPGDGRQQLVCLFKVADIDQVTALLLNDGIEFEQNPALVLADI
ncbi:MAG: hypothetical protein HOM16_14575 [Woeseia sp.]|nr:hypothetical protein [Woeseia sp.]